MKPEVKIARGERLKAEDLVKLPIPKQAVGNLKDYAVLYDDLHTVEGARRSGARLPKARCCCRTICERRRKTSIWAKAKRPWAFPSIPAPSSPRWFRPVISCRSSWRRPRGPFVLRQTPAAVPVRVPRG